MQTQPFESFVRLALAVCVALLCFGEAASADLRVASHAQVTNPAPSYKDYFGWSLAPLGDSHFLAGMPQEPSYSPSNWGAVYLYRADGTLVRAITNPAPVSQEGFGWSVAALGTNRVVVGARGYYASSNTSGRVYLFDADGSRLATLTNPVAGAGFGTTLIALGPQRFVVGDGSDHAFVYDASAVLLASITNPTPGLAAAGFGLSLAALDDERFLVGAPYDDAGETNAGSAYLYRWDGALLLAITNPTPEGNDGFGWSVAGIGGDRILVGAIDDSTGATNTGAAYLYDLDGALLLTITNPAAGDWNDFGSSCAEIGHRRILIGDQRGNYYRTGRAYVYDLDGRLLTNLVNPSAGWDENYGRAVCGLGEDRFVVGVPYWQSGGSGDSHKQGCVHVYAFEDGRRYYVNDAGLSGDIWCTAAGSDANEGTNPAAPKATVQAILDAYDLEPRDRVYVDTGYYIQTTNICITVDDAGSAEACVTLQGSPSGTTIDRNTNSWALGPGGAAIYINAANHVEISGLRLTNAYDGVRMNQAEGCVLRNLDIRGMSGHGTRLEYSNGNTMDGLTVRGCGYRGMDFYHSSNNVARRAAVSGVDGPGIDISYSGSNRFDGCTVAGNDNWAQIVSFGQYFSLSNSIVVASGAGNCCLYNYGGPYDGDYNNFYACDGAYAFDLYTQTSLRDWQARTGRDAHSLCHDPLFADAAAGDFHLKSVTGRWSNGAWAADAAHSPCLDVADPVAGWSAEPAPHGARANLGAHGNTAQASKSRTNAWLLAVSDNNGGRVSGTVDVRWACGNLPGAATVRLGYSADAGSTWANLATNVAASAGTWSWDTTLSPESQLALWRVVLESDTNVADAADRTFMVKTGPLDFYVNDSSTDGDIYCTAAGSDANSGLSPWDPKATVHAILLAYHPDPGDTIHVDTGYYLQTTNIEFTSLDEGSTNGYVTVRGSPAGTVIDRTSDGTDPCGIFLNNSEYVKLHDLVFTNGAAAIALHYGADHCVLSNIVIRNAGVGMDVGWSSYSEFSRLDIRACGDGVDLSGGNYDVFRNCVIAWNSGDGVHLSRFSEGSWSYGTIRNCTIAYNGYKQIDVTGYYQLDLRDSIVVASGSGNACLYQFWQMWPGGHGSLWASDGECRGDYNLLYAENGATVGGRSDEGGTGHVYATLADWRAYSGQETNSLGAEPKFVDGQNLHLRSSAASGTWVTALGAWTNFPGDNSPGIDAGCPTNPCSEEPAWNGGVVNAGAYGNTAFASRSADTDGDALADSVETYRLGTSATDADTDHDGAGDRHEWLAGTDPNNDGSVLEAEVVTLSDDPDRFVISWPSATGRTYAIETALNAGAAFGPLATNVPATPAMNSHTVTVSGLECSVYRVRVE